MNTICTPTPAATAYPAVRAACAPALTHVAALAAAVVGQACTGGVVATDHASVVADDSVQVVAGQLLLFLTDAELAQVQVPVGPAGEVRQVTGAPEAPAGSRALPSVTGARRSPHGELHQVVDLVPPDETAEGEALELHDEHVRQTPEQQLLGGLAVLFALRAVPERGRRRGQDQRVSAPPCPATGLLPRLTKPPREPAPRAA